MSRYRSTSPFQNTEHASAWLRELPWGGPLLKQLHANHDEASGSRWLRMVGEMHRVFHGTQGPPAMFYDDEVDVLGWPALAVPMKE